jgi:predicted patatin/cPLA2 family phospholipase
MKKRYRTATISTKNRWEEKLGSILAAEERTIMSITPAYPLDADNSRLQPQTPAYLGQSISHTNLILEGGAMRGQFTSGVLDFFMEHGLWAEHVIGVSAGALNGYHYVAGDIGRSGYLNVKYCDDWRYLSLRSFALTGNAFGAEFVFDEVPNELEPFNFDAFRSSPIKLTTVASNLETGEPHYFTFGDPKADIDYLRASAAMPLVSKIVEVGGKKLLDGGPCDSVPLLYSIITGAEKHIVVLTQDASYVKPPNKLMTLARQLYPEYPHFCERIQYRHFEYNRTYRLLPKLHEQGSIFVIRPPEPITISNMEKDALKLLDLYEMGYTEAAHSFNQLIHYLESPAVRPAL